MKTCLLPALLLAATLLRAQTRQDYAVFFPVTSYADGWTQLPNTLPECNNLAGDLRTLYGFEATVLPNKNKQEIKAKLAELAGRPYGPDDQLLLYFSMHGYFDEAGEAGCLCPAGAKANDNAFDTWLLHTELRTLVTRIPCEHILVVLDACYSGTFPGKKGAPGGPIYKETPDCQTNVKQALARKTRYYIAAGGKERVDAVSQLAQKMRTAFGGRYNGDDGILSLKELLGVLSEARPEPKDGNFGGDLGGGFVFVPKNGCGNTSAPSRDPDQSAWNHARTQNTEEAYQFYLDTWSSGRFRAEARRALDRIQEEHVWQAALKKGNATAFESYQASYCPGGLYCTEAAAKTAAPPVPKAPEHKPLPDDGLVLVKGGTFQMGCSSEQQDCSDDEKPVHSVTLSDFYIGRHEVTQRLWTQVMGANPSQFKNCDDCPVESVSWDDVQAFLQKLNAQTGRNYRLPTEAEWEYAARGGGKQVLFGNGKNTADPTEINFDAKNNKATYSVSGLYRAKTVPVGSLNSPNALGLHDMSGNVWEWCADWYSADYYKNSPAENPTEASSSSDLVLRGGSWGNYPRDCRVSFRSRSAPGGRDGRIGFRLCSSPQ
ncbi:MAG: SUMF1/EgtB/PvdO family nonheme iron enzyme [Saprospiraceae bacterium]|nr:SUMF1/EgtB/PvdO family nonheme iron enzyme [Saprospiraceae bacterium]